jgi:hypothetical protein
MMATLLGMGLAAGALAADMPKTAAPMTADAPAASSTTSAPKTTKKHKKKKAAAAAPASK